MRAELPTNGGRRTRRPAPPSISTSATLPAVRPAPALVAARALATLAAALTPLFVELPVLGELRGAQHALELLLGLLAHRPHPLEALAACRVVAALLAAVLSTAGAELLHLLLLLLQDAADLRGLVGAELEPLRELVNSVLAHARYGAVVPIVAVTVLNGVAEEVFFRGALFAAIGRRHAVIISTVIYAAATAATGNLMLVFAAFLLGLVLGLQRRASGGILAPILTHVTWSTTMVFALPALIRR